MEVPNNLLVSCLKRSYNTTPLEGPDAKRVKFSDVHESLTAQFPSDRVSAIACSTAVQEAFPHSQKKRIGKERQHYITGIEKAVQQQSSDPMQILQAENEQLSIKVQQLEARIQELEAKNVPSISSHLLAQQMDSLLQHGHHIIHGPSTPDHFHGFSMEAIIDDIRTSAPSVYQLFLHLGDTGRNVIGETSAEQRKAIMSLCTMLNARSQKVNGMQLLLSLMLIARATSKQVSTINIRFGVVYLIVSCTSQAITVLNNAGVCMSYRMSWEYLRKLTTEAEYLQVVRCGHWLWVYDNVNLHQKVRHEREG